MAKKHWIYIKRGLSEDPKHRAAMGECVWLYMHIIDRADWETGIAFDWRDKEEAADMSMPVDTLRRQRQKLEELNYIRTKQKQHSQDVFILEWRNPRDYGCEVKNPRNEGSHESLPSEVEGLNQGLNEGSNQVQAQVRTPTSYSKSKSSPTGGLTEKELTDANAQVTAMIDNAKKVKYENRDKIPEQYLTLCDAYVEVTGQKPTKRVLMDWLSAFSDWVGEGLQPQDIRAAHKHATRPDGGFLVGRPGSLTNTAVALKSKAQTSAPQINEGAVVATLDMIEEKYGLDKEYVPPPAWVAEHMQKIAQRKSINRKGLHR
jgi:hypothetical protein